MQQPQSRKKSTFQELSIAAPCAFVALVTLLARPEYLSLGTLLFLGLWLWFSASILVSYRIGETIYYHIMEFEHPKDKGWRLFLVVFSQVMSICLLLGLWLRWWNVDRCC